MNIRWVRREQKGPVYAEQWDSSEPMELIKHLVENEMHFSFYGTNFSGEVELTVSPSGDCGDKIYLAEGDWLVLDEAGEYSRTSKDEFLKIYRIMTSEDVS